MSERFVRFTRNGNARGVWCCFCTDPYCDVRRSRERGLSAWGRHYGWQSFEWEEDAVHHTISAAESVP